MNQRLVDEVVSLNKHISILHFWQPDLLIYGLPNYPFGRCINLGPGIRSLNKTMHFVDHLIKSENLSTASNLQVLFKGPVNSDGLNPLPSEMEGDSIQMKIRPNSHFKKWRTTILSNFSLSL